MGGVVEAVASGWVELVEEVEVEGVDEEVAGLEAVVVVLSKAAAAPGSCDSTSDITESAARRYHCTPKEQRLDMMTD